MSKTILMTSDDFQNKLLAAVSTVKAVTGVANNAAVNIMFDCFSEINGNATDPKTGQRKPAHPRYHHQVKQAYLKAIDEYHQYERRLIYATKNRLFHVADLTPESRKMFGENITDKDYFEFWKGMGAEAHQISRPLVTSLWNKYRLSLIHHQMPYAEHTAWPMVAMACLSLAVSIYNTAVDKAVTNINYPRQDKISAIFADLSLQRVLDAWKKALLMTEPKATYKLEPIEDMNIQNGLMQLTETWSNPQLMYDSMSSGVEDFDDIFRTKGYMKKALRNLAEHRNATLEEHSKRNYERRE